MCAFLLKLPHTHTPTQHALHSALTWAHNISPFSSHQPTDKNRHSQSSTHASYTEARCAADAGPLVGFCSKAGNFPHCILAHVSCHSSGRHGDELSFLACCAVVHTCCRGRGAVTADAAAAAAPHQNHSKSTKKKTTHKRDDAMIHLRFRFLWDAAQSTSSILLGTLGTGCLHLELIRKVRMAAV